MRDYSEWKRLDSTNSQTEEHLSEVFQEVIEDLGILGKQFEDQAQICQKISEIAQEGGSSLPFVQRIYQLNVDLQEYVQSTEQINYLGEKLRKNLQDVNLSRFSQSLLADLPKSNSQSTNHSVHGYYAASQNLHSAPWQGSDTTAATSSSAKSLTKKVAKTLVQGFVIGFGLTVGLVTLVTLNQPTSSSQSSPPSQELPLP